MSLNASDNFSPTRDLIYPGPPKGQPLTAMPKQSRPLGPPGGAGGRAQPTKREVSQGWGYTSCFEGFELAPKPCGAVAGGRPGPAGAWAGPPGA